MMWLDDERRLGGEWRGVSSGQVPPCHTAQWRGVVLVGGEWRGVSSGQVAPRHTAQWRGVVLGRGDSHLAPGQHNFSRDKNEQNNLGLDHAINQPRKELGFILQGKGIMG